MSKHVKIVGMGKYLPKKIVSAEELESKMGLRPGWIAEKSGVMSRHFVEDETNASMGAAALREALENADMTYEELDLIINASGSYQHPIPETSCFIQKEMGKDNSGIPSFTIDATCVSFVTALDTASCLIECGRYKNIAIVSSEIASKSLNYSEKESTTLLADGAAAAIVVPTPDGEESCAITARMETYAKGATYTHVVGGGNYLHPNHPDSQEVDFTFHMNGPGVMNMAMNQLKPFIMNLFKQAGFGPDEIDLWVPHQASKRALDAGQMLMSIPDEKYMVNISDHGNAIAASIPMALYDAIEGNRIQRGEKLLLIGTAAGLSFGGIILVY